MDPRDVVRAGDAAITDRWSVRNVPHTLVGRERVAASARLHAP